MRELTKHDFSNDYTEIDALVKAVRAKSRRLGPRKGKYLDLCLAAFLILFNSLLSHLEE